ncbi:flagellar hook-associated protein FlgK [Piscirickettsia salmonis]|uniref:flagellar hook-associated protein FlgK n=1 Tax=Piscirickettsia salmonis TaxID=1238 RepID=UPI0012BA9D25|nr:flagellar hook-associated protein FlgK [Piscirickettsia salmonis]QGP60116.1 Flagellar hook-associated protein 1 [Piscirickettsia salmonis]
MGILGISVAGLNAARTQLDTTSHNIANASTPGYTRQRVLQSSVLGDTASGQYVGAGVQIDAIQRMADRFAVEQLRDSTTAFAESDIFHSISSRVDNLASNDATSLSTSLSGYFETLNEGVNEPTSIALRQSILGEANNLTTRFHTIERELSQLRVEINRDLDDAALNLTQLGKRVAIINDQISRAVGSAGGAIPNDLLDDRDRALKEIAEFANISVFEHTDGSVDVSIGSGQSLVAGTNSLTIVAEPNAEDASKSNLFVKDLNKNVRFDITNEIQSGRVKGLIDVRDNVIDESLRQLGLVAVGLIQTTNEQHKLGMDFNSDLGGDFFNDLNKSTLIAQRYLPNSANTGNAALTVELGEFAADTIALPNKPATGIKDLEAEEYNLIITGTSYELIRQSDQASMTSGAIADFPIQINGMRISLSSGGFADQDSYVIRPLQGLARGIDVQITDPKKLALAWPVAASENEANLGSGKLTVSDMVSTNQPINFSDLSTAANTVTSFQPNLVSQLTDLKTPLAGDLLFSVAGGTPDDVATPIAIADSSARALFDGIALNVTGVTPTASTALDLGAYSDGIWGGTGSDVTFESFGGTGVNLPSTALGIAAGTRNADEVVTAITALSGNISARAEVVIKSTVGENLAISLGASATAAGLALNSVAQDEMNLGDFIEGSTINAGDLVINGQSISGTFVTTTALRDAIRTAGSNNTITNKFSADAHIIVTENQGKTIQISTTGDNGGTGAANFEDFSLSGAAHEGYQKGQVTVTAANVTDSLLISGSNPEHGGFLAGLSLNVAKNAFHPDRPGQLDPPIQIEFLSQTRYQVYLRSGTLKPIGGPQPYDPLNPDVFPLVDTTTAPPTGYDPGYRMQISGTPEKGDIFNIEYNTNGFGDNSNAIKLAKIEQQAVLTADTSGNPTSSISQGYESLVASVASETETSIIDLNASETLKRQAQQKRDSIMGVNLDEEAANLIQFQQAYQASARVITVAQTLFSSLLQAVG